MSSVTNVHQALQLPEVTDGHTHDEPIGRPTHNWSQWRSRGYLQEHAIAATKSWLYIPRKYRVHRRRFQERIGNPLYYFHKIDKKVGPRHGPWYLNRFNRQIVYGEEQFETPNAIRPDPMLGFATKHPALWGEEHLRIKHAERSIKRKRHFNDYMNKLTVHCFDTCIHREDFTLENYQMNQVEGNCIRQCFKRTMEAKTLTMSQTNSATYFMW